MNNNDDEPKDKTMLDSYQLAFNDYFNSEDCARDLELVVNKIQQYKRILLIGNGGSHTICLHIEEDMSKLAKIPCLTLSNPGYITCLGNDYGFDQMYREWINSQSQEGDLLIAISSSGESPDIINAVETFGKIDTITLTGFRKDNRLAKMGHINVWIDSNSYGIVESLHATFLHLVLDTLIEERK